MNGIYFALRIGSERHDLCHDLPQLQLDEQAEKRVCLHYCEDVSENPPGRVEGKACETKGLWCTMKTLITQVVASSGCTNCTRASVLQTTQRMPFILRPLQKPNAAGFWYSTQLVGHSKLDGTVARMCKATGI